VCVCVCVCVYVCKYLSFRFAGYQPFFLGVKRPRSEDNHSRPTSSEVNNEWSYTCTPLTCLHGVDKDYFKIDIIRVLSYKCFTQKCGTVEFVDIYTALIILQKCHIYSLATLNPTWIEIAVREAASYWMMYGNAIVETVRSNVKTFHFIIFHPFECPSKCSILQVKELNSTKR